MPALEDGAIGADVKWAELSRARGPGLGYKGDQLPPTTAVLVQNAVNAFQQLTVGRELKMIELKKELSKLRKLVPDGKAFA